MEVHQVWDMEAMNAAWRWIGMKEVVEADVGGGRLVELESLDQMIQALDHVLDQVAVEVSPVLKLSLENQR